MGTVENTPAGLDPGVLDYLAEHHVRCPDDCGRDLYRVVTPTCPTCGRSLAEIVHPEDDPGVGTLRELFSRVRLDCPECGYNLHGLSSDVCPECGLKLRLRDFFGAPAEPVPVPPPFLSEPRGAAWGCVPALVVHVLGFFVNGVMFGPDIFRDPLTTVFAVLAAIDVAVIVGVFVFQRRYRLLSASQRNGLGALCWVWSIAFWVLVCSGAFS